MKIGTPKETFAGESRVAMTPDSARLLQKLGHECVLETGAGKAAGFSDAAYKDAGVEIVTVQGPPTLEGAEGQLVELALALGKERSVLRAQQGARDGLRDRARLKGLPPNMSKPFGMRRGRIRQPSY